MTDRHRVVIVGCGFGGLFAAKMLRSTDVDVTVIDKTNHHLFQPLLYQVATGILAEGDIAPPIRDVLRKQANTRVLLAEVTAFDTEAKQVTATTLGETSHVAYDTLIVAAGATTSYFGHDRFAQDAPGMKTIDDALELRGRIFGALEMAEREPDPELRRAWLTFVVIGAGPTGVEMAGQIAELSRRCLDGNFRVIDPADIRILLLDGGSAVLTAFPTVLQNKAAKTLTRLGVDLHLGVSVTDVDANGISTNSADPALARIEARTKMWAAGVQASPLGRLLADAYGAELDRSGRVKVAADCSVPGHSEIFVIGDLMSLNNLPGVAEVAMQSGIHVARLVARRLKGDADKDFVYRDLGSMATISRFNAVASIGRFNLSGFLGWLTWLFVHLLFLTGFRNRVTVLANWATAFVGRGRPQRTITRNQIMARQALLGRGQPEALDPAE